MRRENGMAAEVRELNHRKRQARRQHDLFGRNANVSCGTGRWDVMK